MGSEYFCVLIPVTFILNADSEEILVKRPNDFLVSRIIRPGLPNSNSKDGDLQIKKVRAYWTVHHDSVEDFCYSKAVGCFILHMA